MTIKNILHNKTTQVQCGKIQPRLDVPKHFSQLKRLNVAFAAFNLIVGICITPASSVGAVSLLACAVMCFMNSIMMDGAQAMTFLMCKISASLDSIRNEFSNSGTIGAISDNITVIGETLLSTQQQEQDEK